MTIEPGRILIWLFLACSAAVGGELLRTEPCSTDDDCVLFRDQCSAVQAVLRASLPANSVKAPLTNKEIYTSDPVKGKYCNKINISGQRFPKTNSAKCQNSKCTLVESISPEMKVKKTSE